MSRLPVNPLKWKRERAGHYTAVCPNGHRFDVELVDPRDMDKPSKLPVWTCRVDWVPFDAGNTLREAKYWCEATADNMPEVTV